MALNDSNHIYKNALQGMDALTQNVPFFVELSKIVDEEEFEQKLDSKILNERENVENAIIFWHSIVSQKGLSPTGEIDKFYEKYLKYLEKKLNKDPKEFCNNQFCQQLIFKNWDKLDDEKYNRIVFDKKVSEILDILEKNYDQIIDKFNSNDVLTASEREFMENMMIMYARHGFIDADNICEYVTKYPITTLDSSRNKLLYLMYIASKKISELGVECAINLEEKVDLEDNCGGYFTTLEDGTPLITINGTASYEISNEEILFKKIFSIYHEIGHLNQKRNLEKFNPEIKQIFEMEDAIRKDNNDLYEKHHDHFFKEKNADEFAIAELEKDFKYNKIVENLCEMKKARLMELYENNTNFLNLLFEEYNKVHNNSYDEETESKKI